MRALDRYNNNTPATPQTLRLLHHTSPKVGQFTPHSKASRSGRYQREFDWLTWGALDQSPGRVDTCFSPFDSAPRTLSDYVTFTTTAMCQRPLSCRRYVKQINELANPRNDVSVATRRLLEI